MVTAESVAAFLGQENDPDVIALAGEHLPVVTSFVRAYTRGRGFTDGTPNDDLGHVITTVCARLTVNPEQNRRVSVDDYAQTFTTLDGFTLPELAILHLYRRRAA